MNWLCCQLGAREHYAIPRALLRLGTLEYLLTDAWVRPSSFLAIFCVRRSKLAERFHSELRNARVKAFNSSLMWFETIARARGLSGWTNIVARNRWFQRKVVSFLSSQPSTLDSQPSTESAFSIRQCVPCGESSPTARTGAGSSGAWGDRD